MYMKRLSMKFDKFISIIVPCKNEVLFIEQFLRNIIEQDCDKKNLEVLIIDGNSDDGTVDIIKKYSKKYKYIKLLHNKIGITPVSLNIGIKAAKGEIIIRMDVHSVYPRNYISSLVYWSYKLGADNVGGKWDIISKSDTLKATAIAVAYGLPISVGNVQYRMGVKEPTEVDTVPFGCYKREVFDNIGLFDEEFLRNQDDEFNFRLKQAGGKIYLVPDIIIKYFARDTFVKLFKQYFQYGWWKPKLFKKFKKLPAIRHFIPVLFVLFLFSGLFSFLFRLYFIFYSGILFFYLFLLIIFAIKAIIVKKTKLTMLPFILWSIFVIHFSYGLGFIKGIWDFILLKKKINKINLTR